jgi:hypothetical protein
MFEILLDYILGKPTYVTESNVVNGAAGRKQLQEREISNTSTRTEGAVSGKEQHGALVGELGGGGREVGHSDGKETGRRRLADSGRDELQRRLDDSRRKIEEDARELYEMRQTVAKQEKRGIRLTGERDMLKQQAKDVGEQLAISTRNSNEFQMQVNNLQDKLTQYERYGRRLQDKLQSCEKENKIIQTELQVFQTQYARTLALLEIRTTELKGAQTFLTTADSLSGAEVTSMVEGLNSEILQTAAFIADEFEFEAVKPSPTGELEAHERVKKFIGVNILHLLTSKRHFEDPMLIQIAVQSCLARYANDMIETWCFNMIPQESLVKVYERMRQSGE